jgi:hypothetical protein
MKIEAGDSAVIYGSEWRKSFLASVKIESDCITLSFDNRTRNEYEYDYQLGAPYGIRLGQPFWFPKMVEIEKLVDQLSIIRNPDYWWRFIQGGITEISEGDFDLIQSAACK